MAAIQGISTVHLGAWMHPWADDLDRDRPLAKRRRQTPWHRPVGALLESYEEYFGTTIVWDPVPRLPPWWHQQEGNGHGNNRGETGAAACILGLETLAPDFSGSAQGI
jgi:hypothetical protein